jgi:hypothetical protein
MFQEIKLTSKKVINMDSLKSSIKILFLEKNNRQISDATEKVTEKCSHSLHIPE